MLSEKVGDVQCKKITSSSDAYKNTSQVLLDVACPLFCQCLSRPLKKGKVAIDMCYVKYYLHMRLKVRRGVIILIERTDKG